MTGIRMEISSQGVSRIEKHLLALGNLDKRDLLDEIGSHLVSSTTQRFRDEEDPEGRPWKPSQRALEEGGKTLTDRGHKRDSVTHVVGLDGDSLEVGSNLIYYAIHHFGGKTGRNHATELPARESLGISDDDEAEIHDSVADELQRLPT